MFSNSSCRWRFWRIVARGAVFVAASVLSLFHVWSNIFGIAMREEEASHILIVPFVAFWLLWLRRDRLVYLTNKDRWVGLVFIAFSLVIGELGLRTGTVVLWHSSVVLSLWGAISLALARTFIASLRLQRCCWR